MEGVASQSEKNVGGSQSSNPSIFGNVGGQLLHGVISGGHRWRGSELERQLVQRAMEIPFEGRGQSGLVAFHATKWASHIHWVHICQNYHRDCKCRITHSIRRSFGLSIKWKKLKWSSQWERNCLSYLSKSGRTTLKVFRQGKDVMGEWLARGSHSQEDGGGYETGHFRCELDDDAPRCFSPQRNQQPDEGTAESRAVICPAREVDSGTVGTEGFRQSASELESLLQRKFPKSVQSLLIDEEYNQIFKNYYYIQDERRLKITNQVWENFTITWNKKSLQQIILERLHSSFNERRYYSPSYSYRLILSLLSNQVPDVAAFLRDVINIFDKKLPKVNSLYIKGGAGAGKTYFINSLAELVWSTGRIEAHINKNNIFSFEQLLFKRMAIFNEFNVTGSQCDVVKEMFEGAPTIINKKYSNLCILDRVPIFITSNNNFLQNLSAVNQEAYKQRMIIHSWQPQSWLKALLGFPHPLAWAKLIQFPDNPHPITPVDLINPEWDNIDHEFVIDTETYNEQIKFLF